jgi:hypothetical protein
VRTPGAKFEDVDLGEVREARLRKRCRLASAESCRARLPSQGEWTEYDEKAGESVSVMDLKHEFRVHREK